MTKPIKISLNNWCDEAPKILETTKGLKKKVKLECTSDDGVIIIILKTKGTYKLKVGYKYFLSEQIYDMKKKKYINKFKETELKQYYTKTETLKYGDSLPIYVGSSALSDIEEENITEEQLEEAEGAYIKEVDIIRLEEKSSESDESDELSE